MLFPTPQAFDQVDYVRTPEQLAEQAMRPNGGGARNLREVIVNELPETVYTLAGRELTGIHAALLPTPGLSDVKTPRRGAQLEDTVNGGTHMLNLADAIEHTHGRDALLQTPSASDGAGGKTSRSGNRIDEPLLGGQAREMATAWGKYEPAIRRWEHLTGPAPAPTEPNKNGNPRLSAAFSQWLMGWPDGWVTDPAIGLSRNDQLRIVGNGVCPQQAAAALRYLIQVAGGAPSYPGAAPAASGAGALLPTPAAGNFNDGEDAKQWLARREAVKERLNNGNGMGMPLSIAVQIMATEYDQ
jgi:site-specific DNA-cytosine methylase